MYLYPAHYYFLGQSRKLCSIEDLKIVYFAMESLDMLWEIICKDPIIALNASHH